MSYDDRRIKKNKKFIDKPENKDKIMGVKDYPLAQELITDSQGQILKVVINFQDYERIIEAIEDEGLYRAMMKVKDETPLSIEEALAELEQQ